MIRVQIIGAGLAGLSAAIALAKEGIPSNLISSQAPERAESVLAAGGINGALNTMGEDDSCEEHMADTLRAGVHLADADAVRGMTQAAPQIIRELQAMGVPFNQKNGELQQRNFGGQKKKRTAFAKTSTGKMIMNALIDEARKYEAQGLIKSYDHHEFVHLVRGEDGACIGLAVRDVYAALQSGNTCMSSARKDNRMENRTGSDAMVLRQKEEASTAIFYGPVIMAVGGLNGLFPGKYTGSAANTGEAAIHLFAEGVKFSNLEMVQYHPTTIGIAGKRCLISEAARGEGGRLFVIRNGEPWYFMEEKYPELGNLMPRDIVAREMYFVVHDENCEDQIYLDMRHLSEETWSEKLSDLRSEVKRYLAIDPAEEPLPIAPAIHYFMGGIDVDLRHQTNIRNLYAAGECCSQYHGANRLGGNSMLGAIYGGKTAAQSIAENYAELEKLIAEAEKNVVNSLSEGEQKSSLNNEGSVKGEKGVSDAAASAGIGAILAEAMGIVRDEITLQNALTKLQELESEYAENAADSVDMVSRETVADRTGTSRIQRKLHFAEAMVLSALARKESRGAHYRSDCPNTGENAKKTFAVYDGEVHVHVEQ